MSAISFHRSPYMRFLGLEVVAEAPGRFKDLSYAIGLAESAGLTLEQASTTRRLMERTAAAGYTRNYYTAVIRVIEGR